MILVTGGTGLVGTHLVSALVAARKQVKAIYRSSIPEFPGSEKVQWVQADILDAPALEEAMIGVEYVYHCAAIVSFNPKKRDLLSRTNIDGTTNIVNAAIAMGVKKLLFVSSVAALGRIRNGQVVNESMHWTKETSNSEYGKTKYLAEMEVWRGNAEGLPSVIVNPTIILGESDWTKGSTEIFKTIHDEFAWYTDGVTGFVDVQDVVRAMVLLMESDVSGERFILSAENLPFKTLFDHIAGAFGKRAPYKKVTPFIAGLVWRYESVKGKFTGIDPILTKETARTAQAKVHFDNTKLQRVFPDFEYTPVLQTVQRICAFLKHKHQL